MGVEGLWKLLEDNNVGQDVTLESMENQIIAIDCSIWLNQFVKGIRDKYGNTKDNAHLLGTFNKICKLLTSKIKPVFVFDGGCPELKKNTILRRKEFKKKNLDKNNKRIEEYLKNHLKSKYNLNLEDKINLDLNNFRSNKLSSFKNDDIFEFQFNENSLKTSDNDDDEDIEKNIQNLVQNTNIKITNKNFNEYINSNEFNLLPLEERYEILTERKKNKVFKYDDLPEDSLEFSSYQIKKLIDQRSLQEKIEETQKEMIKIPDELKLNSQNFEEVIYTKTASDENTSILFIKNKVEKEQTVSFKKPVEKKFYSNIYGDVNDFDYGKNDELKSGETTSLINKKFIKKEKIDLFKQESVIDSFEKNSIIELNDSNSSDDDFVPVDEIQDDSIDLLSFSSINPLVYIYETQAKQNDEIKKKYKEIKKEGKELIDSFNEKINCNEDILNNENLLFDQKKPEKNNKQDKQFKINETDESLLRPSNIDVPRSPILFHNEEPKINLTNLEKEDIIKNDRKKQDVLFEQEPSISTKPDDFFDSKNKIETKNPIVLDISENNNVKDNDCIFIEEENEVPMNEPKIIKLVELKNPQNEIKTKKSSIPKRQIKEYSEETLIKRRIFDVQRQNASVADSMIVEVKQLLTYFGIPYITAVMEAEAQCACLELLGLTNGTITEDGDIFLFGGKTVYKNFFNQNKFITKYTSSEIKERINLDRDHLICLAMLTGSDYTDGIKNVGYITAVEILSEFKGTDLEPLIEFKNWWSNRKLGKLVVNNKVRKKLEKYDLPKSFPSKIVFDAYKNPIVNKSSEKFIFGKPDFELISKFAMNKFNWTKEKIENTLTPIIKRLNERQVQTRIDYFFKQSRVIKINPFESKRLKEAKNKLSINTNNENKSNENKSNKNNSETKEKEIKKLGKKINLKDNKKLTKLKNKKLIENSKNEIKIHGLNMKNNKQLDMKDFFLNEKKKCFNIEKNSDVGKGKYLPLSESSSSEEN